jgi:hypothetical protein
VHCTLEINPVATPPGSHPRRGLPGRLGGEFHENPQHHISTLRAMAGAVNPHFPTTPAAQPGFLHRPSHHLGPRSRVPSNRDYRDNLFSKRVSKIVFTSKVTFDLIFKIVLTSTLNSPPFKT